MPKPAVHGPIPTVHNPSYRSSSGGEVVVHGPTRVADVSPQEQASRRFIINTTDSEGNSFSEMEVDGGNLTDLGNGRARLTLDGGANPAGVNGDVQVKNNDALSPGYSRHIDDLVQYSKPRVGLDTPFASEGLSEVSMPDADYTLLPAEYSRKTIKTSGDLSAPRTLTIPHPASNDESYDLDFENDCTTSNLIVSTGSGATLALPPQAYTKLKVTTLGVGVAIRAMDGVKVNVMNYYKDTDTPVDSYGTMMPGGVAAVVKNISTALNRAFNSTVAIATAFTLFLPPTADYDCDAYSTEEALTWNVSSAGTNALAFQIEGSGEASKIIPGRNSGLNTKLYVAGAGPQCLSQLFSVKKLVVCGDNTVTNDCECFIRTSVDMHVLFEDNIFYSVQSNSALTGVLYVDAMGAKLYRNYFHGCANSGGEGAVVNVGTCCFGGTFEQCEWYPWERTINPFGGVNYDKASVLPCYEVLLLGGGNVATSSRIYFDQVVFGQNARWGAVLAKPGVNLIDTIHFRQVNTTSGTRRLIEARTNVQQIVVEYSTLEHNATGDPAVDLQGSTCRRLTLRGVIATHSGIGYRANTGQQSVIIENCTGGTYTLDGVAYLNMDWPSVSSAHGYTSSVTPAPAARVYPTDIEKNDATDLTLTATQYARKHIRVTGTPGGDFNVIGPSNANSDGAEFRVTNLTPSALTFKAAAGVGVTIAAGMTADVQFILSPTNDYKRMTPDAG